MTHWNHALSCAALACFSVLAIACLPGGGSDDTPEPTPTREAVVRAARTVVLSTPTATPFPTVLPATPLLTTYTVKSGDTAIFIAEIASVPAAERDAWISEMLALNGVDAYSLQVGQELILPPFGNGTLPSVNTANRPEADSGSGVPPASLVEPAQPLPTATSTPPAQSTAPNGSLVPFAPTPPFVAFTTPTATPTPPATATPIATATPTVEPTIAPGERAWLTSSEEAAIYYYCDLDEDWKDIPPEKLLAFDSEQQLLAIWGRFRVKAPDSAC